MHHIKVNNIEEHLPDKTKYNVHYVKFIYNKLYLDDTPKFRHDLLSQPGIYIYPYFLRETSYSITLH